jgi:PGAP1-like protein
MIKKKWAAVRARAECVRGWTRKTRFEEEKVITLSTSAHVDMNKHRSQTRFAVLLVVASLVFSVISLQFAAPASAAPTRNDSQNEPVYFVPGIDISQTPGHDCNGYWGSAMNKFRALGWTGSLHSVAYYAGDTNCSIRIASGDAYTSIKEYGRLLAWDIYNRYSRYGQSVDIVAHSMGGLVARAAITGTTPQLSGWPPYIYVEDAVTIGTPHNGTGIANGCGYTEMRPGSTFLNWLADNAQAAGGTDWTMIGTEDDDVVPVASATIESGGAGHYVWYYAGQPLEHSQQTNNVSGTFQNSYWNYSDPSNWHYQTAGQNIITTAKNACYYWNQW